MTNISGVRSPFFSVLTIKNYALRFYAALDYCMRVMYNINQVNNGERSSGMGTVFLGYTTKDVTHATKDDISAAFGEEYAASLMKNDASARSDSLCGAALLLLAEPLEEIRDFLTQLADGGQLPAELFAPLVKTVGVALVSRTGSDLCRDAGEGAMASLVETAGAVIAILVSLPLFQAAWDMLRSLL